MAVWPLLLTMDRTGIVGLLSRISSRQASPAGRIGRSIVAETSFENVFSTLSREWRRLEHQS
jgi:hypothetical protein